VRKSDLFNQFGPVLKCIGKTGHTCFRIVPASQEAKASCLARIGNSLALHFIHL